MWDRFLAVVKGISAKEIMTAKELARKKVFTSERITKLEIASGEMIAGLLNIFSELVTDLDNNRFNVEKLEGRARRLARLMGSSLEKVNNKYDSLLCVTDFVSGMTDRFAVDTYRTLTGISI